MPKKLKIKNPFLSPTYIQSQKIRGTGIRNGEEVRGKGSRSVVQQLLLPTGALGQAELRKIHCCQVSMWSS